MTGVCCVPATAGFNNEQTMVDGLWAGAASNSPTRRMQLTGSRHLQQQQQQQQQCWHDSCGSQHLCFSHAVRAPITKRSVNTGMEP
jgi:hypothetical protein